jgi:hypothetical protein
MKVLVTGSRNFPDESKVHMALDVWADGYVVVGDCPTGADKFARQWCDSKGVECEVHYADWDAHGRAAGPIRNQVMIDAKPDLVIAFYHGDSRGTRDCVRRALIARIPVLEYYSDKKDMEQ